MTDKFKNIFLKLPQVYLLAILIMLPAQAADQVQIREDAPSRYEVVDGDTLWDISGRFLEDPWLWPEVWELNPQIENPHLIYPGDVIELEYSENGPLLTLRRGGSGVPDADGLRTVRLSPQVRRERLNSAIPAIPLDSISSFLQGNVVISQAEHDNAPYLFANRNDQIFGSNEDIVFAKGSWDENINLYDIVRGGVDYIDPLTGEKLGIEGKLIGTATITKREGDNATLVIRNLLEEARIGDRFLPVAGNTIDANYFPRPPEVSINAGILDINGGRLLGSLFDTLVINKGSRDRLEVGDLLALQKPDLVLEDTYEEVGILERVSRVFDSPEDNVETFDGHIFGSVLIYRVFDNTSMGIILSTEEIVRREDKVVTP